MLLQASFDPPGLSVAVKKDRAAEALLSPGAKFIVNIMAEGHERPLMKQLLRSFKPGEDRFAGLDIEVNCACQHPSTKSSSPLAVTRRFQNHFGRLGVLATRKRAMLLENWMACLKRCI